MATPEQVELLKRNWRADPCWDIETTEGFEEYRTELLTFAQEWGDRWQEEREERQNKKATQLGCPSNLQLGAYLLILEQRIGELEQKICGD